jgi:hypothetical protein
LDVAKTGTDPEAHEAGAELEANGAEAEPKAESVAAKPIAEGAEEIGTGRANASGPARDGAGVAFTKDTAPLFLTNERVIVGEEEANRCKSEQQLFVVNTHQDWEKRWRELVEFST